MNTLIKKCRPFTFARTLCLLTISLTALISKAQAWDSTEVQGKYTFGNYWIQNNMFGLSSAGTGAWQYIYWSSYTASTGYGSMGWQWNYPNAGGGVKAYPYIGTVTSKLPSQVSANRDINVQWEFYPSNVTGRWNNSLDLWLMQDSNFYLPGKVEIMIWLGYGGNYVNPSGVKVFTTSISGAMWEVWKGTESGNGQTWDYYAFRRVGNVTTCNINLRWFMNTLVDSGWLNSSYYLTQIHAGMEIFEGSGSVWVNKYRVY